MKCVACALPASQDRKNKDNVLPRLLGGTDSPGELAAPACCPLPPWRSRLNSPTAVPGRVQAHLCLACHVASRVSDASFLLSIHPNRSSKTLIH